MGYSCRCATEWCVSAGLRVCSTHLRGLTPGVSPATLLPHLHPLPAFTLHSLFGYQVVYSNQAGGAGAGAPPSPPADPSATGAGFGTGSVLGVALQPWQQLLQQRPVLAMMEQNIAAIASGVGEC